MQITLDDAQFCTKNFKDIYTTKDTNKLYSYSSFKVKADFHHFQLASTLQ